MNSLTVNLIRESTIIRRHETVSDNTNNILSNYSILNKYENDKFIKLFINTNWDFDF